MVKRGTFQAPRGTSIVIISVLLMLLSSSLAMACETGVWTDKCTYKAGSTVTVSYKTDIVNGAHVINIQKDGATLATFDKGTSNASSATWSPSAEGKYTVQLLVNSVKLYSCEFNVRNDDIAPTTSYSFSKAQKSDGSYDTGVQLSFTATDNAGGSGVAAIYYWGITGTNHLTYKNPIQFDTPGTYTVTFKAMDNAGNLETVNGNYRTLTFAVTSPAPAATPVSTPEPTPAPTPQVTATPTSAPTAIPTEGPAVSPTAQSTTLTGHDVNNPMAGTESYFAAESDKPTTTGNSGIPGSVVTVGVIGGVAVVAGAALLLFRKL